MSSKNTRGKRISRIVVLICLLLAVFVPAGSAAQQAKIPLIGFLSGSGTPSNPAMSEKAFRQGLKDLGYIDGKNIVVEVRYAEGNRDRIPNLVAELIQTKIDMFVTGNLTAIRAAKQATQTIPIVMVTNSDPVAIKLIDSLSRPGGNITGITNLNRNLSAKRLELLKEIVPKMFRVAVLWDQTNEGSATGFKEYETATQLLTIQLQSLVIRVRTPTWRARFKQPPKSVPMRSSRLGVQSSCVIQRRLRTSR